MTPINLPRAYLDNSLNIPVQIDPAEGVTIGDPVQNAKVGGLKGDLWMGDNGKIVVNDSDWRIFDPSLFTYSASNIIAVSGLDVSKIAQIGDRVKWKQTTEKFGFVIAVSSINKTITVTGGSDYAVTNAPITEMSISDKVVPDGFPSSFNYDLGISGDGRIDYTQSKFFITGPQVLAQIYIHSTIGFLSLSTYDVNLPTEANVWASASGGFIPSITYSGFSDGHGSTTVYALRFDIFGAVKDTLTISDPPGGTLLGMNETGLSFVYPLYVG